MYKEYIVTGAAGFLGSAVVRELLCRGVKAENIRALALENEKLPSDLPEGVVWVRGDVTDDGSLGGLFLSGDSGVCVIHCAGMISVASEPGQAIYRVNIDGTKNIISRCLRHGVEKLVYVSSVHAIPELPEGDKMREISDFSPDKVNGAYAKSKAAATAAVLAAAEKGLNASVVHPSGIIGPGDEKCGNITRLISAFIRGRLPFAVKGGYDFVDVRDVAKGIFLCTERGKRGKCYILSGHYATVSDILKTVRDLAGLKRVVSCVPMRIAEAFAPLAEKICVKRKKPASFTPYALAVLASNGAFSHETASEELGYCPRPLKRTLSDTLKWLRSKGAKNRRVFFKKTPQTQ